MYLVLPISVLLYFTELELPVSDIRFFCTADTSEEPQIVLAWALYRERIATDSRNRLRGERSGKKSCVMTMARSWIRGPVNLAN
jgi:hypothetical protein